MTDTADLVKELTMWARTSVPTAADFLTRAAAALSSTQARADKLEAEVAEAKREIDELRYENGRLSVRLNSVIQTSAAKVRIAESSLAATKERVKELEGALERLFNVAAVLKFEPDEGQPHPLKDGFFDRAMDEARRALKTAGKE